MHDQNLKDAIFTIIFDDETIYRKMYIPMAKHIRKNPKNKDAVREFIDTVSMKFAKLQDLNYQDITNDIKQELSSDVYDTIIDTPHKE